MDILAWVQPRIHAELKIAACVLISLLFVIQVQLLFCGGGGATKQQQQQHLNGHVWLMAPAQTFGMRAPFVLTKRAPAAEGERVAVEAAVFSRLSRHVCHHRTA